MGLADFVKHYYKVEIKGQINPSLNIKTFMVVFVLFYGLLLITIGLITKMYDKSWELLKSPLYVLMLISVVCFITAEYMTYRKLKK